MVTVGLIVNPVAGMGGVVGLKGTDGEMYRRALDLGAQPVTAARIKDVLSLITRKDLRFLAAKGIMGEDYLKEYSFDYVAIGRIGNETTAEDTKEIARQMIARGIDLLIFVGGDGTARDILDVVGMDTPVIAIPSGVKMFSSVFALSAHAAAEMINTYGDRFTEKEVLDIDEEAFRDNRLVSKLYGYVKVPDIEHLLQSKKAASNVKAETEEKKHEVAEYIVKNIESNVVYILGPGTTIKAIAELFGVAKTLLGVDALFDGKLVGIDIGEKEILALIEKYGRAKIIVTPIGGNGFIFGRGSKQISAEVLRLVGKENIIVVSTLYKVGALECLRIDTGDYEVDKILCGKINVVIGYNEEIVMEVRY